MYRYINQDDFKTSFQYVKELFLFIPILNMGLNKKRGE
jgi:hypothetical protein